MRKPDKQLNQASERTVKTLLLCKLKPEKARNNGDDHYYSNQYSNIYDGPEHKGVTFISLGNTDAISIYETTRPQTPQSNWKDNNWFQNILLDRKRIIQKATTSINYHSIHLVANVKYENNPASSPFCVVSLIYGVLPSEAKEIGWVDTASTSDGTNSNQTESDRWARLFDRAKGQLKKLIGRGQQEIPPSGTDKPLISNDNLSGNLSSYESKLHNFFKKKKDEKEIPENTTYEIYNAVNICDAVVIWYTDDLMSTLRVASKLNNLGLARKTFTLVGFLWDKSNKTLDTHVCDSLSQCQSVFNVRIQGSIRNQAIYQNEKTAAKKDADKKNIILEAKDYAICGQSDFSILLENLNGAALTWLLRYYLCDANSKKISEACWEIHTELLYKETSNDTPILNDPYSILGSLYQSYSEIFSKIEKFPWSRAFFELLSVHANVDSNPILYGPGYLFFNFLDLALDYFRTADSEETKTMLISSRDSIQEFIRGWSGLTDQLLRVDDLIFHGFGNSTALYNTLPECALDFYHSFILSIVDLLVNVDRRAKRILDNNEVYKYDFILLPELDRGVSITPMFNIADNTVPNQYGNRVLWPNRQAFIVYFPIETVFSPTQFFAPLVHECFHYFGDACRMREKRYEYVCGFISGLLVNDLGFNSPKAENVLINKAIFEFLYGAFPETETSKELNNQQTVSRIESNLRKLFCDEGLDKLRDMTKHDPRLYQKTIIDTWKAYEYSYGKDDNNEGTAFVSSSWEYVAKNSMFFFKECYADCMMILVLGLTATTYINLFVDGICDSMKELDVFDHSRTAQRIALVLATFSNVFLSGWEDEIKVLIKDRNSLVYRLPADFLSVLQGYYNVLVDPNAIIHPDEMSDEYYSKLFPASSMKYAMDYLVAVHNSFKQNFIDDSEANALLRDIQETYGEIFIKEGFLNKRYFQIIRKQHNKMREREKEIRKVKTR